MIKGIINKKELKNMQTVNHQGKGVTNPTLDTV